MILRWRVGLPLALLAMGSGGDAFAQARDDGFSVSAAYSFQHDSNLFRLPDGVDPMLVLGRPSASENIDVSSLGLRYAQNYSLQRVELDVGMVDYRYSTYSRLDLQALNYDAKWRWQLTPRWRGSLFSSRKESVNSFNDTRGAGVANQSVQTNTGLDALYEIDGVWRAVGGVRRNRSQNQQQQVGQDSYRSRSTEIGLLYDARSGNDLSYRLRRSTGQTLDANGQPRVLLRDDTFTQTDHELQARWALSGKSTTLLTLTHLSRTHPGRAERDYSGVNAAAAVSWSATGKTLWSAGWSRDLSGYQTANASYARAERLNLGFAWQIGPRTSLNASLAQTQRRYMGAPAGQASDPRRDTTRDSSIGVNWSVTDHVNLNASLQRTQRSANMPGLAFSSNQAVLGVSAGF